ncbi:MAG: BtrH N-terminal domain-containing protein [Bradymonadaceae bacterium]
MKSNGASMPVVEEFEHRTGVHCGSTAAADLLRWAGVELSEAMVFGLGSGAGFFYLRGDRMSPTRQIAGRSAALEENAARALGLELVSHRPDGAEEAWRGVERALDEGRPVMIACDLSQLPYWDTDTTFNGHRIVCAGYEGDDVLVADTDFEGLQRISREQFQTARSLGDPPALEPPYKWWELERGQTRSLESAVREALVRNVESMRQGPEGVGGLDGLGRFKSEVGQWTEQEDAVWCYRFAYQCIEERGTGGGNFRLLYRDYLREAEEYVPELAEGQLVSSVYRTARSWTTLAEHLAAMATYLETEGEEPEEDPAHHVESMAEAVYQFESTFWGAVEEVLGD